MLSKRVGRFLANLVAIILSFTITYVLRFGWDADEPAFNNVNDAMVLSYLILSYLVVLVFYRPNKQSGKRGLFRILKESFITGVLMAAVFSTLVYTTHIGTAIPRMFFGYFFVIYLVLAFLSAAAIHLIQRRYAVTHKRKTVVFTDEADKAGVIRKLIKTGQEDFEVVGVVAVGADGALGATLDGAMSEEVMLAASEVNEMEYFRVQTKMVSTGRLAKAGLVKLDPEMLNFKFTKEKADGLTYLKRHQVDLAILSMARTDREVVRGIIDALGEMGVEGMITTDSFGIDTYDSKIDEFGTTQMIRFAPRLFTEGELFVKRTMDIIGSLFGCVICVIVGILVGPAIYICDPGPIIFKQKRVGRNGKYFNIYKFRSMYKDAPERREALKAQNEMDDDKMFKIKDDPRITKVGRFLRKTSLDELPQFFNVLKGEMSLVGTRPPMVDEYKHYSRHHKRRLTVKPGITGLWQVSGRNEITDFEEIVKLDCYYIDHWSVLFDIKILLMTVGVVVTGRGSE